MTRGWFGQPGRHREAALKGHRRRVIVFWKPEDFEAPSAAERGVLAKAGFAYLDRIESSSLGSKGAVYRFHGRTGRVIGIDSAGKQLTVIFDDGTLAHVSRAYVDNLEPQKGRRGEKRVEAMRRVGVG